MLSASQSNLKKNTKQQRGQKVKNENPTLIILIDCGVFFIMHNINEDQILIPEIDLGAARKNQVDESYLYALGGVIKYIMKRMFVPGGGGPPSFKARGTRSEIDSFLKALGAEKKYLDSFMKLGLDNPKTYSNSRKLAGAARNFEKVTKLKWPFK